MASKRISVTFRTKLIGIAWSKAGTGKAKAKVYDYVEINTHYEPGVPKTQRT